jgi:hypothetical protein
VIAGVKIRRLRSISIRRQIQMKKILSQYINHRLIPSTRGARQMGRASLATLLIAAMMIPTFTPAPKVTANSGPEQEIQAAQEVLEKALGGASSKLIGDGERKELLTRASNSRSLFKRAQICESIKELEAFLAIPPRLRDGERAPLFEDLYNQAWSLRQDLLSLQPKEKTCPGGERANLEPVVDIAESDNRHIRGVVRFGEPKLATVRAEGEQFTDVELPGVQAGTGEPGLPGVPVFHRVVAVPQGAKASISVKPNFQTVSTLRLNLHPVQPEPMDRVTQAGENERFPAERFEKPKFTRNKEIYATDRLFPAEVGGVVHLGQARDLAMAQFSIAAGQYNPIAQTLTLFESVEFEIVFEGGDGAFLKTTSLSPFESASSTLAESAINAGVIHNYQVKDFRHILNIGEEFLILTHPDFRPAADALAAWKNQKGILTHVYNVRDGAGPGPDTRAAIDAFIENRYYHSIIRPSYVLLLGDAEFIPPFYVSTSGSATTGSDYPYALLPGDDLPDFALGRIPVDTLDQANTVVNKIISYEKDPPSLKSFYKNVGIASQFQCCRDWPYIGRDQRSFIETSELVRNELLTHSYGVDRIYTKTVEGTGGSTPIRYYNGTLLPPAIGSGSGFAWDGDTTDIINAWNNGRFLFLHRDHGWENGWAHPGFTSTNVTANLTNGELQPVVFSVNCASGLFDNETAGGDYGTNAASVYFSERLLRKADGGAVGILGDTRNSPTWANSALTRGFFDAVWPNTVPTFGGGASKRRLGDILNHGKLYLATQVGVAGTTVAPTASNLTSELYMWHVIGDPTLEMWKSVPLKVLFPWLDFAIDLKLGVIQAKYQFDGATLTAYQEIRGGVVPIARGVVRNGEASLPLVNRPVPGVEIHFVANAEDAVSEPLSR